MCSVTNIHEAIKQRQRDEQDLKDIDFQIADAEKAMVILLHRRRELINRLGLNKPDHDPEAA
ncbi:hypothetical protein [Enterobacter sp. 18A13]|uniref:hypothetical protein n=1 Tax=Enterobacter sp. 18A13 TaxID=2565914 RepID=UPI0010CA6227|nr:hypothetical protein [Enterobacter sp. 18A13]BBJ66309.1 hypothetical protein ECC18A13_008740 [Enterobacter sp. 18A13]